MEMALYFVTFVAGLILLVWSADKFVEGAACVASGYGIPPLLVGMVIVGFGTSAPELMVSALSALDNNPGIALGNAYGSNIANIALVLGLTLIIKPIGIAKSVMTRELPLLLGVTFISLFLIYDGLISAMDGLILIVLFTAVMLFTIRTSLASSREEAIQNIANPPLDENQDEGLADALDNVVSMKTAFFWTIAGLILLIVSARILVWGAVQIAVAIGVTDVVVGLTIVAIGTSLPELAAAVAATRKNEHDLVIGNIIGSNFFNTLAVVGLASILSPIKVPRDVIERDLAFAIGLTLLLWFFGYCAQRRKDGNITRYQGFVFVGMYCMYIYYLISLVVGQTVYYPNGV